MARPESQATDLVAFGGEQTEIAGAVCAPVNHVNPAPAAIVRGCNRMSACHPVCAALSLDRSRLEAIPANKGPFVRDNRRLSGRRAVRGGRIIR
jgi:hypothetical protein